MPAIVYEPCLQKCIVTCKLLLLYFFFFFFWSGSCRLPGDAQWQRYNSGANEHIKDGACERSALPLNIE